MVPYSDNPLRDANKFKGSRFNLTPVTGGESPLPAGYRGEEPQRAEVITNRQDPLTKDDRNGFYQKIAMIGYGVYGRAIHSRLAGACDIKPWERRSSAHPCSSGVTTDLKEALDGRGVIMMAVPSNAFQDMLGRIRPHPESIVISFAKGLIVPGWDPLKSEQSLREGPAAGSRSLTPLEYIAEHPNWKHIAGNSVFAGGPGFAQDVQDGAYVGLTLGGKPRSDGSAVDALGKAFDIFSGMTGDKSVEVYYDSFPLEIAAAMKNVAAFAAGIVFGILKKKGALKEGSDGVSRITDSVTISHGEHQAVLDKHTMHRLVQFASRETVNVVKSEGGGKGGQLMSAGNHDLNLTVHSLTSRNVQAGMRLAMGENIYDVLTTRDNQGHQLTAEGVFAVHALARRIQNNTASEAFAPLVFSLRNILIGRSAPEAAMAEYFGLTKQWTNLEAHKILNGQSKPLDLRLHPDASRN